MKSENIQGTNLREVSTDAVSCVELLQEIVSGSLWNPISLIVSTTSLLPIVPTNTSAPRQFNAASNI